MESQRRKLVLWFLAGSIVLMVAQPAFAQFGAVQRTLFRGMELAGNHLFVSNPQGGPFFNDNIFSQRLEFNRAADGYTYEQWRFFGEDSFGNPTTLDLGPLKIDLGRDPTLLNGTQPVGLHTRVGFTQRFIPEIFFQQETAQRLTNVFAGTTAVQAAPLRYTITLNTGVEDVQLFGNILLDTSGRLNALGFYDLDFRVTNVGTLSADGMLLEDQQTTDFEIGPIDVSGHIVLDAIGALVASIAGPDAAIPTRVGSGAAQRDKDIDEIIARAQTGETLTEAEVQALVNYTLVAALLENPLSTALNGIPSTQIIDDVITLSIAPADNAVLPSGAVAVPEPGTLGLIAAAAAAVWIRRRRAG